MKHKDGRMSGGGNNKYETSYEKINWTKNEDGLLTCPYNENVICEKGDLCEYCETRSESLWESANES